MKWCVTNSNNVVVLFGECSDSATSDQFTHLVAVGHSLYLNCPDLLLGYRFDGDAVTRKPDRPSDYHEFDDLSFSWVLKQNYLAEAKERARERINVARNAAELEPFAAFGKAFDADDKAIQRILGAAQAAVVAKQLGQPLSIEWTCADNTTLIMDADMLIEIPVILAQTADALHQKARALKAQIDAATTLNEIAAIVW